MESIRINNPSRAIIVCAPPFQNSSAGIVVLHELCDALIQLGYVAHIVLIDTSKAEWSFHLSEEQRFYDKNLKRAPVLSELGEKWIREVLDRGITIYPEIVSGNPLNAKNVVRYFLNSDGVITGKKSNYQLGDYCLGFSKVYFENPNAILFKPVISPIFNEVNSKPWKDRNLNLTYFGKGPKYVTCFRIDGSVVLPGDWPKSKAELALLLQNTQYLYCWDNQTGVITDAIYCGAKVVLLQFSQANEKKIKEVECGEFPYLTCESDSNRLTVIDNPNYENIKNNYMEKVNYYQKNWLSNVDSTINNVFKFFSLN
jgi:hypothetical protein